MTHEELLQKVSPNIQRASEYPSWDALRAVIELHNPKQMNEKHIVCVECSFKYSSIDVGTQYPCSTIKAIEKVLV